MAFATFPYNVNLVSKLHCADLEFIVSLLYFRALSCHSSVEHSYLNMKDVKAGDQIYSSATTTFSLGKLCTHVCGP